MASYLATTRNLGLLCVKSDLHHLIMDKTALPVSDGNIPHLVFERMKMMTGHKEKEQTEQKLFEDPEE